MPFCSYFSSWVNTLSRFLLFFCCGRPFYWKWKIFINTRSKKKDNHCRKYVSELNKRGYMKERRSEYLGNKYKEIKKRKKQKKNGKLHRQSLFYFSIITAYGIFIIFLYILAHTHTVTHRKKVLFLRIIWTLLYILPTFTLTCTTTTTNSHVGLDQALVHDKYIKNREKTHKNCKIPLFSRLLLLL